MSDWVNLYRPVVSRLPGFRDDGGGRGRATCPCDHGNERSDLWLSVGDRGSLILRCYPRSSATPACRAEDVLAAIGLKWNNLFPDWEEREKRDKRPALPEGGCGMGKAKAEPDKYRIEAEYEYYDPDLPESTPGDPALAFVVVKKRFEDGTKDFPQKRPNPAYDPARPQSRENSPWLYNLTGVTQVLFGLPQLRDAIRFDRTAREPGKERSVFVVEGEQDVLTAWDMQLVATCNPGGVGKWKDIHTKELAGCNVILIPDEDPVAEKPFKPGEWVCPGIDHVRDVALKLLPVVKTLRILRLPDVPPKGDLTDWRRLQACNFEEARRRFGQLLKSVVHIKSPADVAAIRPRGETCWPIPAGARPVTAPVATPVTPANAADPQLFDPPAADPTPEPAVGLKAAADVLATYTDLKRAAPAGFRSVAEFGGEVWSAVGTFQAALMSADPKKTRQATLSLAAQLLRGLETIPELKAD